MERKVYVAGSLSFIPRRLEARWQRSEVHPEVQSSWNLLSALLGPGFFLRLGRLVGGTSVWCHPFLSLLWAAGGCPGWVGVWMRAHRLSSLFRGNRWEAGKQRRDPGWVARGRGNGKRGWFFSGVPLSHFPSHLAAPIPKVLWPLCNQKFPDQGVPIVAQWKRIRLGTKRLRVRSLASLSGLRIWHCCELWCRSQRRLGSGITLTVV